MIAQRWAYASAPSINRETGNVMNTNRKAQIMALEDQLQAEDAKIKAQFAAGKIPLQSDYTETDRIKRELKTARRLMSMDANRADPKLTRKISILLPDNEYQTLTKKADNAGVNISKYIRYLINNDIKSGG